VRTFIILSILLFGCDDTTTISSAEMSKTSVPTLVVNPPPMPGRHVDDSGQTSQDHGTVDSELPDAENTLDGSVIATDDGLPTVEDSTVTQDSTNESDSGDEPVDAGDHLDTGAVPVDAVMDMQATSDI
jgi:hypothetical protein